MKKKINEENWRKMESFCPSNGESSRESGHPDLDWNRDVI